MTPCGSAVTPADCAWFRCVAAMELAIRDAPAVGHDLGKIALTKKLSARWQWKIMKHYLALVGSSS